MTATHVFYSPKDNSIVDTCSDETPPRSHWTGETLAEIRKRYPDAVYMEFDKASKIMDEKHRLPVMEITKERWWEMLEVLPPQGWKQTGEGESFKMIEHWSGSITDIYVRIHDHDRYFVLRDNFTLAHSEVIRRCNQFIKGL